MNRSESIQAIMESWAKLKHLAVSQSDFGKIGLSRSQIELLHVLNSHSDLSVKKVAQCLGVSLSAITQLTDPLVEAGLVKRLVDDQDRRIARLSLSGKGDRKLKQVRKKLFEGTRSIMQDLSDAELKSLETIFNKMLADAKTQKEQNWMINLPMRQKITIMLAVMSGMMLAALDQTIVATALPRIVTELHGLKDLSWVVTVYLLTSTISFPISGKLSDIYGRKKLFLAGIAVFVVGSALSGLSQNMAELIGFRAFQGIGAGLLMSNAFAVIGDLFTPKERGRWQCIIAGVFGLASVIGPLLGGYLTDHASWRWIFYVNVPVGILAFFMITTFMPHIASSKARQRIDYAGAGLLAVGLSSLLLAMVWGGNQYAWGSVQVITAFAAAAALLGSFGVV